MGEQVPFTVIDRRGQKKEAPAEPLRIVEAEPKRDGDFWKERIYFINFPMQMGPNTIIMCKGMALRQDEKLFTADYAWNPYFDEASIDPKVEVRKRLNTFLNCGCKTGHICGTHEHYLRDWQHADMERLQLISARPMPEALEVFMKAAQGRANAGRIVTPDLGHR